MTLVVKKDTVPDPGHVALFGSDRIVLASYGLTNPIPDEVVGEKFPGALSHDFLVLCKSSET